MDLMTFIKSNHCHGSEDFATSIRTDCSYAALQPLKPETPEGIGNSARESPLNPEISAVISGRGACWRKSGCQEFNTAIATRQCSFLCSFTASCM